MSNTWLKVAMEHVKVCAWCKKVFDKNSGEWVDGQPPSSATLTHGICQQCYREVALSELDMVEAVN